MHRANLWKFTSTTPTSSLALRSTNVCTLSGRAFLSEGLTLLCPFLLLSFYLLPLDLLEKSRIVSQEKDERNYHIFYMMFYNFDKARLGMEHHSLALHREERLDSVGVTLLSSRTQRNWVSRSSRTTAISLVVTTAT